jgi:site-specific recombinase XerD
VRAEIGKIGWHTLRHTYSTLLHELGAPLAVQKDLLCHSDIRTNYEYLHSSGKCNEKTSAEKVQSILIGKKGA